MFLFTFFTLLLLILLTFSDSTTPASKQTIRNTYINNNNANVKATATRGMVIDAGSGGSRLHVFQWKPRIFHTVPPPLSYPEANEHWTARMDPGIHNFADNLAGIADHLASLIDFAKVTLSGSENEFSEYPIYFKATGGMRELEVGKREAILGEVQRLLMDKSFCPFYFKADFARVISGEEEAIFSWAATNFLKGTLLPASHGIGEVKGVNMTYGTIDLGGASAQIAFYLPSQDILEGLFKLQIGGQKEWNVYTKSFLQYGINSARQRFTQRVADNYFNSPSTAVSAGTSSITIESVCFHTGYSEVIPNYIVPNNNNPKNNINSITTVQITGPSASTNTNTQTNNLNNKYSLCRELIKPLLEKSPTSFCAQVYHNDCSVANAYQPPLPHTAPSNNGETSPAASNTLGSAHGNFLGTSTYKYAWVFLQLPETASLRDFDAKAVDICKYNYADLQAYYNSNNLNADNDKMTDIIPYTCFIAAYISVLLQDGYGFWKNDTVTVIDTINGHKVGWALGAILYEINELPWVLRLSTMESHAFSFLILASVAGFFLGILASVVVYREILRDKYKALQDFYADQMHTTHDDDEEDGDGMNTLPHVYSADLEQSLTSSRRKEKMKTERKRRKSTGNIYSYNIHSPEISYKYEPELQTSDHSPNTPSTSPTKSSSDHPTIRALHQTHSKKSLMAYYYAHYQQKYADANNGANDPSSAVELGSMSGEGSSSGRNMNGNQNKWSKEWDGVHDKGRKGREEMNPLLRQASGSDDEDMGVASAHTNRKPIYAPSKGGWMSWVGADSAPAPAAGVGLGIKSTSSRGNLYGTLETNESSL
eukprot:gene27429-33131_t